MVKVKPQLYGDPAYWRCQDCGVVKHSPKAVYVPESRAGEVRLPEALKPRRSCAPDVGH